MQLYLGKMDLSQLSIKVQLLCVSRSEANGATLKVYAEHTESGKMYFFTSVIVVSFMAVPS